MSKPHRNVRVNELVIGREELLVVSFPIDDTDLQSELTEAEREVARLAIEGLSNSAIAEQRGTSTHTVANQMASVLRRLGLESRRELAARWRRRT